MSEVNLTDKDLPESARAQLLTPEQTRFAALALLRGMRDDIKRVGIFFAEMYPTKATSDDVLKAVTVPVPYIAFLGLSLAMEYAFTMEKKDADTPPSTPAP